MFIKSKLLLILLSGALVFAACSDSSTDSGDDGDEPVEPTVSVNNPSDGATVEGEITFSIDGNSENGFDEARIFIDDQNIETVSDPSLPHDKTINTLDYNNGDYDLRAELDASGQDTTVKTSISVTVSNYLVELQTDNYISGLKENTEATYLFISDPSGKVLREIELTARSDGNIKLLPPSMIDGDVPPQFSITIGRQTSSDTGVQHFGLNTHTGFQPWSDVSQVGSSSQQSEADAELDVDYYNFPEQYSFGYGQDANFRTNIAYLLRPTQDDSLPVLNSSTEAMISLVPGDGGVPQYYRETSLSDSVDSGQQMKIDVTEHFQEYSVNSVTLPSGYEYQRHISYLQGEESFSETDYFFLDFNYPYGMNPASDEALVALPDISGRSVGYWIRLQNSSDNSITIEEQIGDQSSIPSDFTKIDAEATFSNKSLDDVQVNISGSADYMELFAIVSSQASSNSDWQVWLPDTTESYVFPKIADSLNSSVTAYNRSDLQLSNAELWDFDKYDGYNEYLNAYYGSSVFETPLNYRLWEKNLTQSKVAPLSRKELRKRQLESGGTLQVPTNHEKPHEVPLRR